MGPLDDKDSPRRLDPTGALKRLDSFDDLDIDQTRTEPLKRLCPLNDRDFKGGRALRGPCCWAHCVTGTFAGGRTQPGP